MVRGKKVGIEGKRIDLRVGGDEEKKRGRIEEKGRG